MKKLSFLLLLLCFSAVLYAQAPKNEQEQKVDTGEVPELSKAWLEQAFTGLKRAKWYKEVTSGKTSFEAKFKYKGSRYSVEFAESGIIEDVEKKVSMNKLTEFQREGLYEGFAILKNFKLMKIQEQWTATTPDQLIKAIKGNDLSQVTIRYEVEFRAEINGMKALWEGLFTPSGQLLSKRRIVLRPTDNLDY